NFTQQHEGLVKEMQRPNGCFDPARIDAIGQEIKRSQLDYYPALTMNVLRYAGDSDPKIKISVGRKPALYD
ncbi:MAG: hypothetical protein Q9180_009509, partial [Flavoplaca navasiana]